MPAHSSVSLNKGRKLEMSDVKVNLPTIDGLVKGLVDSGTMSRILTGAGQVAAGEIQERWLKAKGADNVRMKKLSPGYEKQKRESLRNPIPDLNYHDDMSKTFRVRKANASEAVLAFSNNELKKARKNYDLRPNMLNTEEPKLHALTAKAFGVLFKKIFKL